MEFEIVTAVNDENILNRNLRQSPLVQGGNVKLHVEKGYPSASQAYIAGLGKCSKDIVVFAHQDVYIPSGWEKLLKEAIQKIDSIGQNWGVLGVFGVDSDGSYCGRVWSSGLGKELNYSASYPHEIVAVDELLIVLNRNACFSFDGKLPAYHLYGTDIVQEAKKNGYCSYVFYGPVVHNSRPVRSLDKTYGDAYKYMARKWREILPMKTCIVPVTKYGLPLWKYRIKKIIKSVRVKKQVQRIQDPKSISKFLGYEKNVTTF